MFRRLACAVIGVLLVGPSSALAAPWTGILDPSRAIDWSLGNQGVSGGIPARTTICTTLGTLGQLPSFVQSVSQMQIQNAIFACPTGQTVLLNPGTYFVAGLTLINGSASLNGVTFRGSGPDQTIMKFTGNGGCSYSSVICMEGSAQVYFYNVPAGNIVSWTAGYAQGTTVITLSSTAGLHVGNYLVLDQLDDNVDPGGVSPFICFGRGTAVCHLDPAGTPEGRTDRAQQQTVKITAINGTQVTISPGLYMTNWRNTQTPQAWWWDNTVGNTKTIQNVGIESMTLDFITAADNNQFTYAGVHVINAVNVWIYRVRSLVGHRNHIWLHPSTKNAEVRDSYFWGTKSAVDTSYGVENESTDALVINNIAQHVTTPYQGGAHTGAIVAYNYMTDMFYSPTPPSNCSLQAIVTVHQGGAGLMTLVEGNETNIYEMDINHGSGANTTVFRNQLTGSELGKVNCINPIAIHASNRVVNIVGNILGVSGVPGVAFTRYENTATNCNSGTSNTFIYYLGFSGANCFTGPGGSGQAMPFDTLVSSSSLRWGNYDYFHTSVQWNSAEIPSGNAVPATHTLPASFFLTSQPTWMQTPWGTPSWPVIGPDVTGGQDSSGFVYKNAARLCYENAALDLTYTRDGIHPILFIPTTCYAASGPAAPGAPTNFTIAGL